MLFPDEPSLIVLIGMPTSGKSTYASQYPPRQVAAYDAVGRIPSGAWRPTTPDAWQKYCQIVAVRAMCRLRTIADYTNLLKGERHRHLEIAARARIPCHAVVFTVPLAESYERSRDRGREMIEGNILRACHAKAERALRSIPGEGFDSVTIHSTNSESRWESENKDPQGGLPREGAVRQRRVQQRL
ncbi:MAG: AAA family ATPase [Acidobacteria bacterium]|nr:AAA family ATPase [Acidobacteriota bacterium]